MKVGVSRKKEKFTKRSAQSIAEQVVPSDINNVAKNNKLTEKKFGQW
jgi:hypothetical protein